jgi:hypothetical protein
MQEANDIKTSKIILFPIPAQILEIHAFKSKP